MSHAPTARWRRFRSNRASAAGRSTRCKYWQRVIEASRSLSPLGIHLKPTQRLFVPRKPDQEAEVRKSPAIVIALSEQRQLDRMTRRRRRKRDFVLASAVSLQATNFRDGVPIQ